MVNLFQGKTGRHFNFMGTTALDKETLLQIQFHKLKVTNSEVTIVKNKAILNRKFLILLVFIAIISYISSTVLEKSPDAFKKPLDVYGILLVSIACFLIILNLYLSTKRLARVLSDFKIKTSDCLYINSKPVATLNAEEKATMVIQAVSGWKGIGTSYTVGVAAGKKFWGLCYELDDVDANKVANFLSRHLGLEVERKESALFPLFKLH
jgi:hypothetical protein